MVIVMSPSATDEQTAAVVSRVQHIGGEAFVSHGDSRTIIGLIGDADYFETLNFAGMAGVDHTVRISTPFKLVAREHHPDRSTVWVGTPGARVPIGPGTFTMIAGPCAVETHRQTLEAARMAKELGATLLRGGAFKPRTSPYAFQGLGISGLEILADVSRQTGLPVVTEVVCPSDVAAVVEHADMLQIGTRNMANFSLLQEVGHAGKPVLLKRGMSASIEEWIMAAEYIAQRGNLEIVLCERGIRTFETATRNTLDLSAVPVAQGLSHLPIIVDPSHSGGHRHLVEPLSTAAVAAGADGLIVDVHPDPSIALCDGPQALTHEDLEHLTTVLTRVRKAMLRVPALPENTHAQSAGSDQDPMGHA